MRGSEHYRTLPGQSRCLPRDSKHGDIGRPRDPRGQAPRGLLTHRVRSSGFYWGLLFAGYLVNLGAVPPLALAGRWQEALLLVILERLGKGLRAPVRDVILAEVGARLGRGRLYALHEFLDQLGAVSGPLLVAWSLTRPGEGYAGTFLTLIVPAVAALLFLILAFLLHPSVEEARATPGHGGILPHRFLAYSVAAGLSMAGLVHWTQASYRASELGVESEAIALAYSVAMLSDALATLIMGWAFDRVSPRVVLATPLLTLGAVLLLFMGFFPLHLAAVVWGAALGGYESVYRSVAADFLPRGSRALGFGVFHLSLGLGWTLGNLAVALLPVFAAMLMVLLLEATALFIMVRVIR